MQQQKILFITTGGTIASQVFDDGVKVACDNQLVTQHIQELAAEYAVTFDIIAPFNKNSENIMPADWHSLLQCILVHQSQHYAGIIITHGTDTLPYSMAAVDCCKPLWQLKICFTGSFYTFESPQTDALLNLRAAFKCVLDSRVSKGVYLAFRNSLFDKTAAVYAAAAVKLMDYDTQIYTSLYQQTVAIYSLCNDMLTVSESSPIQPVKLAIDKLPRAKQISQAAEETLFLQIYPGLTAATIQTLIADKTNIVVALYHSGTAAERLMIEVIKTLKPNQLMLMASYPHAYMSSPYQSTAAITQSGGLIIKNLPPYYLYVLLVIASAAGMEAAEIKAALSCYLLTDNSL